jgi:hypothetical protein
LWGEGERESRFSEPVDFLEGLEEREEGGRGLDLREIDREYGLCIEKSMSRFVREEDVLGLEAHGFVEVSVTVSYKKGGNPYRLPDISFFEFKDLYREACRRGIEVRRGEGYAHVLQGGREAGGASEEEEEGNLSFDIIEYTHEMVRREREDVDALYI